MKQRGNELWTIHELGAEVARALASGYAGAPNGRVRELPDLRTIRYYTTLGLLDRPLEMRGRTALYGRRHLLQLVAIKKLQARGLALSEVQHQLAGMTDAHLEQVAGPLPEPLPDLPRKSDGARPSEPRPSFWKEKPSAASAESSSEAASAQQEAGPLQAVALAEGVVLLLSSPRPPAREELPALRAAAADLIRYLTTHQLIPTPEGRKR